ncbi:MAG: fatty acid desaturase, partial [Gemmataceae bacterium]
MHALLIAFHEAAHGGLCPWWPLNEYLARAIGGFACISVTLYRIVHQWHHAYLGTPRDEEFWPFTDPLAPRSTRLLAAGSELTLGLIHTPLIFLRALLRPGSRIQVNRWSLALIYAESALPILFWVGLGIAAWSWGFFPAYAAAYLAPAALAGNLQSWRKFIEHIGLTGRTWATLTRAIRPIDMPGHALSTSLLHEPYHDLHHRYPKIPQESLPKAAEVDPPTAEVRPVFPNYRAALSDLMPHLADPKFGPAWEKSARALDSSAMIDTW